jgi:hypothetical protein
MVQSALLDELEVEGQNGEITATGTPCWMIGRDFLLCQGRSGCFGFCGKSCIGVDGFGSTHCLKNLQFWAVNEGVQA